MKKKTVLTIPCGCLRSGNRDPDFRYCADIATSSDFNGYMMNACDLQASSSGGPWFYPFDATTGSGTIISVNSYGYASKVPSGMGGPKLFGNSAKCLFDVATSYNLDAPGNGYIVDFSNGCPLTQTPTDAPIAQITAVPSVAPTNAPISKPTDQPTATPVQAETASPMNTAQPTVVPTNPPTSQPTNRPTEQPTDIPTKSPTDAPVVQCIARQLNCANAKFSCCETEYCGSFVGEKQIPIKSSKGKNKTQVKKVKYNYTQCALKKARNVQCEKNNECASGTCKKKRCS
jgi:PT repeat